MEKTAVAKQGCITGGRFDGRLLKIAAPLAVTTLAALFRLPLLGQPDTLVFDETYYVKDSYALTQLGYEAVWPEDANAEFNAGNPDVYTKQEAFIVHPQLGKWLMALGQLAFGADNPIGWRISTALLGVAMVPLMYFVALLLFRSYSLAMVAGFLIAIDGHAIVSSRTALLDGIVAVLALAGFLFILKDYHWYKPKLLARLSWLKADAADLETTAAADTPSNKSQSGLSLFWWRPWLFTAGLVFGLAGSVKWTGLYFLPVFGIYVVVCDLVLRAKAKQTGWFGAGFVQAWLNFFNFIPIAIGAYLLTWWSWFQNGGYLRNWAEIEGNAWTGLLSWIPRSLQSLWEYHLQMYGFHIGLHGEHPYSSPAWSWLFLGRPTLFYTRWPRLGEDGCTWNMCSEVVTDTPNPTLWIAALLALLFLILKQIRKPDWAGLTILAGLAASYIPWLLLPGRTVFFFYAIVLEPYFYLALTMALGYLIHTGLKPKWKEQTGIRILGIFLLFQLVISLFWYPVWIGMQVPYWFWQLHIWSPFWI